MGTYKMNSAIYLITVFLVAFVASGEAATNLIYQYDANGNLINGDGMYYEYNDANQLVKVRQGDQNGAVIAEYVYDYTGQRIKKIENGVPTYYIGKHYETAVSGNGATNTSYYFANGERVAKKDPSGSMFYYHSDHLGGTNVVTNTSGNFVERIKYYPFGEIREGGNEKYQFTGKETDKLTDFYYFEARYYDADFKHFTQADILEPNIYDPQSLNHMAYVRNNPVRLIDPNGLFFMEAISAVASFSSKQVDRGVNYLSNTGAGNWLGDQTLKIMGANSVQSASPEVQAAFYGSLAEGLDHTYAVTKKATWTSLKASTSLMRGPDAVISDFYDLSVMLLGETGYASAYTIDALNAIGDIASLGQGALDIKDINKKFHFSRNMYRELSKTLGKENYSRFLKYVQQNRLDKGLKILKTAYDAEKIRRGH